MARSPLAQHSSPFMLLIWLACFFVKFFWRQTCWPLPLLAACSLVSCSCRASLVQKWPAQGRGKGGFVAGLQSRKPPLCLSLSRGSGSPQLCSAVSCYQLRYRFAADYVRCTIVQCTLWVCVAVWLCGSSFHRLGESRVSCLVSCLVSGRPVATLCPPLLPPVRCPLWPLALSAGSACLSLSACLRLVLRPPSPGAGCS